MTNAPEKNEDWLLNSERLVGENLDDFRTVYDVLLRINFLRQEGIKNLKAKHIDLSTNRPTIYEIIEAIKDIWTLDKPGVALPIAWRADIGNPKYDCLCKLKVLSSGIVLEDLLTLLDVIDEKTTGEKSFYRLNYFNIDYNDITVHSYSYKKIANSAAFLFIMYSPPTQAEADIDKLPFTIPDDWSIQFQRSGLEYGLEKYRFMVLKKDSGIESEEVAFDINWTGSFNEGYFAFFCGENILNFDMPIIQTTLETVTIQETKTGKKIHWIIHITDENYIFTEAEKFWNNKNERMNLMIREDVPSKYTMSVSSSSSNNILIDMLFQQTEVE